MVRVSFAVRPPDEIVAVLAAVPRPVVPEVTWTLPERWIVKLRPLGHVPVELYNELIDAVATELDGAPPVRVGLGPTERRYSGQQLSVPVSGLDELSEIIFAATSPLVPVTHPQPFYADLVLAGGRIPVGLAGTEVRASWVVTGVSLLADRSSPQGVRVDRGSLDPVERLITFRRVVHNRHRRSCSQSPPAELSAQSLSAELSTVARS